MWPQHLQSEVPHLDSRLNSSSSMKNLHSEAGPPAEAPVLFWAGSAHNSPRSREQSLHRSQRGCQSDLARPEPVSWGPARRGAGVCVVIEGGRATQALPASGDWGCTRSPHLGGSSCFRTGSRAPGTGVGTLIGFLGLDFKPLQQMAPHGTPVLWGWAKDLPVSRLPRSAATLPRRMGQCAIQIHLRRIT